MLGRLPERLWLCINDGAADARRTPASTHRHRANVLSSWIGSRCRTRYRRAAERALRGTRVARDAVPTPAVIANRSTPDNLLPNGGDGAAMLTALEDFVEADINSDPNELSPEQLESRRMSSRAASTSARTDGPDNGVLVLQRPGDGGSLGPEAAIDRGAPASSPAFPAFPRPKAAVTTATTAAGGPLSGPLTLVQVPPEAAQLYAGSAIAGNLSATGGSADVLTPLLDSLQLEPPAPSVPRGSASNAQRVYRTAASAAIEGTGGAIGGAPNDAGAGGAATTAASSALPLMVRRKRARTRVLDASELLLARDEAVRTELISHTWNDLLRFEERLRTAPTYGAADTAAFPTAEAVRSMAPDMDPKFHRDVTKLQSRTTAVSLGAGSDGQVFSEASEPPSLDAVLDFLQEAATALKDQQLEEQAATTTQVRKAAERSARLMGYITRAPTWQRLARLFLKHGRAFSVPHLVATLVSLARFDAMGRVYRGKGRRKAFDRVWDMLTRRITFAAPRMTGGQVVQVVRAIGSLPFRGSRRVKHSLVAMQRVLRYSQHTMLPQMAPDGINGIVGGGAATSAAGKRVILNASQMAQQRGARSRGVGQKGRPGLVPLTDTSGEYPSRLRDITEVDLYSDGGLLPMGGADYAALCYTLGRINSRARPYRISLRLPPSVSRRLLLGTYSLLGSLGPRELAGLLYGLGCMRLSPPAPWMYGFYVNSARWLPSMTDVQLTMVMYGACRLRIKPPPPWIEAYLGTTGPRLRQFDGAGLAAAMHSLGRLQYKPRPGWVEAFMASVHDALTMGMLRPGEMSQLVRGMMFLRVQPTEDVLEALWETSGQAMERSDFSPAQLANMAWALGLLKVPTPRGWYDQLVHQMRRTYPLLRPYHRRRLLLALHAFGCRDLPRWYQLLRIPLEEMPGYGAWSAQQAKQRADAKAAKHMPAQVKHLSEEAQGSEATVMVSGAGAAAVGLSKRPKQQQRQRKDEAKGTAALA
ncbi:hypothetical protein Vretimale_7993 [Volvox reticuliferus]|uniref:Uncharacterized protein n=1 Tax=Volvox reticuliferus TaxID=1737510 RepID=A0A8J4G9Z4_9CHLO|nr:hypothetical protein Vretifemale_5124 [Volvox reticuliferus]GIM03185.1 hypothetical protein Vretimale_7993 [Volvox reticuliferus]